MNTPNNKRYLVRVGQRVGQLSQFGQSSQLGKKTVATVLLCASVLAGAQEPQAMSQEPEVAVQLPIVDDKTLEAIKPEPQVNDGIVGFASYYAAKFHGRRTSSGETFSSKLLTAAHKTLPFGTLIKVTNLRNKKSVIVRVNDRGPFIRGRIVDLSSAAAELIGMKRTGTARVKLEIHQP